MGGERRTRGGIKGKRGQGNGRREERGRRSREKMRGNSAMVVRGIDAPGKKVISGEFH